MRNIIGPAAFYVDTPMVITAIRLAILIDQITLINPQVGSATPLPNGTEGQVLKGRSRIACLGNALNKVGF